MFYVGFEKTFFSCGWLNEAEGKLKDNGKAISGSILHHQKWWVTTNGKLSRSPVLLHEVQAID